MILCLDVGNSQMFAGVFRSAEHLSKTVFRFRKNSTSSSSSDELGVFLRSVLRENEIDPKAITAVAVCTVVPALTHSLRTAVRKYFAVEPFFLQAGVRTGLKIKYRNPAEVGADRIANGIGAVLRYPGQDVIVIDFGTATTLEVVTSNKEYLGGAILPGIRTAMEALYSKTALLPTVEIVKPQSVLGRSTVESIQSGLYYGAVGMTAELVSRLEAECFEGRRVKVIGTGGFSRMLEDAGIFTDVHPDLVLEGLLHAYAINLVQ